MPNIPNLPEDLQNAPGVAMNAPPAEWLPQTEAIINNALKGLRDEDRGKLVWIATKQGEQIAVNAAVAQRIGDNVRVTAWIGKTWGQPVAAGIAGDITW